MAGKRAGTQRAGNKDRKIKLQRYITTQDEYGSEVQTWETFAEPWAEVDPIRLTETFMNGSERTSQIRLFRISYIRDVKTKDRILYEGYQYDITGVREIGRRQTTELEARALD